MRQSRRRDWAPRRPLTLAFSYVCIFMGIYFYGLGGGWFGEELGVVIGLCTLLWVCM